MAMKIKFPDVFTYSRFRFRIKLMDKIVLNGFTGSMLRGIMGTALHQLNCQSRIMCKRCKQIKNCAYSILFKPELVFQKLATPPFVIFAPGKKREFSKGEGFEFFLTLFGQYARYFDYFLNAFNYGQGMGLSNRRIPYQLEEIVDDVSGEWVYRDRDVNRDWKVSSAHLSTLVSDSPRSVRIEFQTPTFLRKDRKAVCFPDIKEVIRSCIRRIHILNRSIWHEQGFMIAKGFLDALKVSINGYDLHYEKAFKSGGLGTKVELSGFTGTMEVSGNLEPFYLLLRAGEILHIGSRTSYGLGKYDLRVL